MNLRKSNRANTLQIFISYSSKDYDEINALKKNIGRDVPYEFIFLKHRLLNFFWRKRAKYYICQCDCVLCIVSAYSLSSKFISWEIQTARKMKKKIFYVTKGEPGEINKLDNTMEKVDNISDLRNKFLKSERDEFENILFNQGNDFELKESTLFEQYKIMVGTSEELVKRRQVMNTFFLTLNLGILSAIGIVVKRLFNISDVGDMIFLISLSAIGGVSAYSWRRMIISFGQLNNGKFKVINALEKYLSVSIFNAEWVALGKGKNKKKYSSFTSVEKNVPNVLLGAYILVFIGVILYRAYLLLRG